MDNKNEAAGLEHKANSEHAERTSAKSINRNFLLLSLTFLLAIIACVMAFYTVQLNKQIQNSFNRKQASLGAEIEQLKANQNQTRDQINSALDTTKQDQAKLKSAFDHFDKEFQGAMKQHQYQTQDWLLLKAKYYLELAQINAQWSTNPDVTIALLQEGDKLLQELNSTEIFAVRQSIAKDIAALKAVTTIDVAGLLIKLDAAQNSVSTLNVQSVIDKNDHAITPETDLQATQSSTWRSRLQGSLKVLEKLVIVRRNDEDVTPLMSPLYESILKESIRLNLQEAQWALLNNNPVVYQLALKQAIENLQRTFSGTAQDTSALVSQIQELQKVKLVQEKPAMGQALPLLNQIIESKPASNNSQIRGGNEQ